MNKRAMTMAGALLLGGLLLAGCSDAPSVAPSSASPTPTPTPTKTAVTTQDEAIAAANEVALEFFRIWDEVTLSEDPTDVSPLEEVARDAALDTVQNIQNSDAEAGITITKGGTKWSLLDGQSFASESTFAGEKVPFGAVTLFGCADYSDTVGEDAAGEEVPPLGPWKDQLTLAYWPDEERWYVTGFDTLQDESDECAG
ncbi:hypothetical protein E4U02_09540 [Microbacterium paludicola]|uniref:Uncharacterized protein n=1 Tax=Microbacterium paludicola TaxID=300019 RepID=A0A4Y9FVR1_9MICO|nr:hypothetical protein [Microbacterium paludicola]MBF0816657.1 hypothetical protein [Microbacterium paludicola]TFU32637.1 hypothetical protein E4U02_09540 [Microbacterium paludicola]